MYNCEGRACQLESIYSLIFFNLSIGSIFYVIFKVLNFLLSWVILFSFALMSYLSEMKHGYYLYGWL